MSIPTLTRTPDPPYLLDDLLVPLFDKRVWVCQACHDPDFDFAQGSSSYGYDSAICPGAFAVKMYAMFASSEMASTVFKRVTEYFE